MQKELRVSCFSAGVSSAVATKLAINEIDVILYTHIDDQHEDTMRFVKDCEAWFGKQVQVIQSPYRCVENVVIGLGYPWINGGGGASCTKFLKRRVRKEWELNHEDKKITYFWGMDVDETKPRPPRMISRVDGIVDAMPKQNHRFPLVERKMTKVMAHEVLRASGIHRPQMYDLGYQNNNCVGCVKGGMWYWNKIRKDFPEVFKARAELERKVGASCINGVYLDELDPNRGRADEYIDDECGIMCELIKL